MTTKEFKQGKHNGLTKDEEALMLAIATRAAETFAGVATLDVLMDLEACHQVGCKLDLKGLLTASVVELSHDIGGIGRYLNRETGELTQCFTPRYAAKYMAAAKTA